MARTELEKKNVGTEGQATAEATVTYLPPVDIWETAESIMLTADMPGVDDKSVDILLDRNLLTIRGKAAVEAPAGFRPAYREYASGNYERSFTLGETIDRSGVQATVRNGVLSLVLPKVKEARPRRIEVQAG